MSAIDDDVKAGLPVSNVETDKKYETHTDEWATIRAQAKTDEDVQHDLTLWKALITYKTVRLDGFFRLTGTGCILEFGRFDDHYHGVIRPDLTWKLLCFSSIPGKGGIADFAWRDKF